MPPQAGVFALPYKAARNADTHNGVPEVNMTYNSVRSPLPPGMLLARLRALYAGDDIEQLRMNP